MGTLGILIGVSVQEQLERAAVRSEARAKVMSLGIASHVARAQRILIARALYRRPGFLVIGESTSHLDLMREERIALNLAAIGTTQLVDAHQPATILASDQVYRPQREAYHCRAEDLREKAGMSKVILEAASTVHRKTIERIEKSDKVFFTADEHTTKQLAKALGISEKDLAKPFEDIDADKSLFGQHSIKASIRSETRSLCWVSAVAKRNTSGSTGQELNWIIKACQ